MPDAARTTARAAGHHAEGKKKPEDKILRYIEDWEAVQRRYVEYWHRENHDRPILRLAAPRQRGWQSTVPVPERIEDRYTDMAYQMASIRDYFANIYYGAEGFPFYAPNLGPDFIGALLGCPLTFAEDTVWVSHLDQDWSAFPTIQLDRNHPLYQKMLEMTAYAVREASGDFFVGMTDLHPGADTLAALRGPEKLCIDLIEQPEVVSKRSFEVLDIYKQIVDDLYGITTHNLPGSACWMGIWHPGKSYPTSSDFICLISQTMFDQIIYPEIAAEIDWFEDTIFHLDGPQALRHLDTLLENPKLRGIQWVYGAGTGSAGDWISVLKKIQNAGKIFQVHAHPDEMKLLFEHLRPEGAMYTIGCRTPDEVDAIVRMASDAYR